MHAVSLLVLAACVSASLATPDYRRTVSYEGEILIRCTQSPPDVADCGVAVEGRSLQSLLENDRVDVWTVRGDSADLRLPRSFFEEQISSKYPECFVLNPSVEALVQQAEKEAFKRSNLTAEWHEEYHPYVDIVDWYKKLASDNPSVPIKYVESIGQSVEGRDQPAVHIGSGNIQIYSQCQIHAREWISGATCMYIVDQLVKSYSTDERVTKLLQDVEFVFIPLTNPDGYEYTWTNNRLWRKNRREGIVCDGVDLNRNYDDHWGGAGSTWIECIDLYRGPSAASEPETQNTQKYFQSLENVVGAIDWHSYGQLILRPHGWTNQNSTDEVQLKALGDNMRDAIKAVHNVTYTSGKFFSGLYPATGTASDWFYSDQANMNNKYRAAGYTIELRDTGTHSFVLPPEQIIPTGEEMFAGFLVFADELMANPLEK